MQINMDAELANVDSQIKDLEFQLAVMRSVRDHLKRAVASALHQEKPPVLPDRPAQVGLAEARMKPGSFAAHARDALKRMGQPTHIDTIIADLDQQGVKATGRTPMKAILVSAMIRSKVFTKKGKGVYGLAEWDNKEAGPTQ